MLHIWEWCWQQVRIICWGCLLWLFAGCQQKDILILSLYDAVQYKLFDLNIFLESKISFFHA